MNVEDLIRVHLKEQHAMQLATVKDGQPWCCTVYFVADDSLNLYWASKPERRHSQDIAKHGKVAAAIAVKDIKGEKVIGIQVEGNAEIITSSDEILPIATSYANKFGRSELWIRDFTNLKTDHQLYKLTPRLFVLFDEVNFPHDTRLEWIPNSVL